MYKLQFEILYFNTCMSTGFKIDKCTCLTKYIDNDIQRV